jgi:hypothetical protein
VLIGIELAEQAGRIKGDSDAPVFDTNPIRQKRKGL